MLLKLTTRIERADDADNKSGASGSAQSTPKGNQLSGDKTAAQIERRDLALEKMRVAETLLEQAAYDLVGSGCYDHVADLIKMSAQLTHIREKEGD